MAVCWSDLGWLGWSTWRGTVMIICIQWAVSKGGRNSLTLLTLLWHPQFLLQVSLGIGLFLFCLNCEISSTSKGSRSLGSRVAQIPKCSRPRSAAVRAHFSREAGHPSWSPPEALSEKHAWHVPGAPGWLTASSASEKDAGPVLEQLRWLHPK